MDTACGRTPSRPQRRFRRLGLRPGSAQARARPPAALAQDVQRHVEMRRRVSRLLTAGAVVLLASTYARADVVWPALYLESRLLSLWAIPAGLAVEFAFLRWWLGFATRRAILADVTMNGVSAATGIVLVPIAGLAWELVPGQWVNSTFDVGTFNPISWTATCALAVLINTAVEGIVLRYGFKALLTRWRILGLAATNAVSVGLALASLGVSPLQL